MKIKSSVQRFIVLHFFMLTHAFNSNAQFSANDSLLVGKRGNVIWDRKINVFNLGNERFNYYYKIYYKTALDTNWMKIGLLGQKLEPFFKNNQNAAHEFMLYRKKKKQSYILLTATASLLAGWTYYTAYELNRTGDIETYIKPIPLAILSGYFVCFHFGRKTNIKGDIKLIQAVRLVNND